MYKMPILYSNEIKKYADLIVGHFSTIVNTINARAQQQRDAEIAEILNDLITYIFRQNAWDTDTGKNAILQALLTGIICVSRMPVDTGRKDEFGRPIYDIEIKNVPIYDLVLDPASKELDYSDARWIQRQMWMTEEQVRHQFPDVDIKTLTIGGSSINSPYTIANGFQQNGRSNDSHMYEDMYSIVHWVTTDIETTDDEKGTGYTHR